jgi:hypothetical protein
METLKSSLYFGLRPMRTVSNSGLQNQKSKHAVNAVLGVLCAFA